MEDTDKKSCIIVKGFSDILLKGKWRISIFIFLLAAGVRFCYLYQSSYNPSFNAPTVDSDTYDVMAKRVAAGKGMNDEFFWQPFLYPYILSIIYRVCGPSIVCAKVIQVLLGCVTCVLTYRLGEKIFGRGAGIIAGIVTALYGPLIFFEAELLAVCWAAFWSVVVILILIRVSVQKSVCEYAALGICGALSILTRPNFLVFFVAACIWLVIVLHKAGNRWQQVTLRTAGIVGGFLLIAIPVAVQNLRITGKVGILPASGGINFFIGNNPDSDKTVTARPGWEWEEITSIPQKNGISGGMWEEQKYFYRKVINFALTQPYAFTRGLVYKAIQSLSSRELPRNVDVYVFRKWSWLLGLLVWKVGKFGFPFGVLLPLALVGLITRWRQTPLPIKLFLFFYPLSIILVFISGRYRTPIVPVMSITAAAGILSIVKMIRTLYWPHILTVGICVVAVVLLSALPGPFPQEKANFEAELYANAATTNMMNKDYSRAIEYLNKALSLQPDYPSAHANLGTILAKNGRIDEAIEHYNLALDLKPDSSVVLNNLADALASKGKFYEAIACLNKALKINADYAEAHFNMGNILLKLNKVDEAIGHYTMAVKIKPDYIKAHSNLAVALASRGEFEQAAAHFAKVIGLQPDNDDARYNLAKVLMKQGHIEQALVELREVLKINPTDVWAMDSLAEILATSSNHSIRKPDEAVKLARTACEITAYKNPELLKTLAQAYASAGSFSDAVLVTEKALKIAYSHNNKRLFGNLQKQFEHYRDTIKKTKKEHSTEGSP